MSDRLEIVPVEDQRERRVASTASGLLRRLNQAGVLTAADVHVADRLGRLGGEEDEQVRAAAALAVRAVRAGSVCVDLARVVPLLDDALPGEKWPDPAEWAGRVGRSGLAPALHVDEGTVYLDRYWREESQVVADLRARAAAPAPVVPQAALDAALASYFPDAEYADQRAAAEAACGHWTTVVTGGPGTGKTTTVARLLGVLMRVQPAESPLRVALAAPTGKAAARMAHAVREAAAAPGFPAEQRAAIGALEATTLHRLLGSLPSSRTRFRHDRSNRLPHDVVIVDETSMVSLTLMARLLEAVRPSARLVLVGDADQLASVEAGAVLTDLVAGLEGQQSSPVRRLGPSRRFGAEIGALAEAVRAGDGDAVVSALAAGGAVEWVTDGVPTALLGDRAVALHRAGYDGDRATALSRFSEHRLLCAHRDGPYGVAHWNRATERLLADELGWDHVPEWYPGQPLVVNANDYGLGLFNGDTGVVCRPAAAGGTGLFAAIEDGTHPEGRAYATSRLAEVSTAHALTVHRSQGSQFDEVTVLLPEPESPLLTRELLYTAVTRARSHVRVVGGEETVRAAVARRAQRATGLARRLT